MADRHLFRRFVIYPLQALGVAVLYEFFRVLPVDTASAFAGWLGRMIGRRLGITRRAERNLERALPELDAAARTAIVEEMWDNLGRTVGELPHLARIVSARLELAGEEHILPARDPEKPCIVISGHFANWETLPPVSARIGVPCVPVYRAANNPLVDRMLRRARGLEESDVAPKGREGARRAVAALREGRSLGMLLDQKMNDGIAVPFFGRDAMTATAAAQLSRKYGTPMVPARIERLEGCRFRITFLPAISLENSGDPGRDIETAMRSVNMLFEGWIRERPSQWLWLHSRWPDT